MTIPHLHKALQHKTAILICLSSVLLDGCSWAAPSKAAPKAPVVNAKATTSGVVQITPITRNETLSKETVILADGGKALLPIIISAKASDATKAHAEELANYLKRVSGATFEIKTGDGSEGIVLGTLAEFPTPALDKALQIFEAGDGKEAFAVRTREKRLLLLGATERGVPHAVFRFLKELGYRHFFSHPAWEVVPKIEKLSFKLDITDRPQMLSRMITLAGLAGVGGQPWEEYLAWKRHNGQAQSFVVNNGHNMQAIIDANKAEFDKHPEYYALMKKADGTFVREAPMIELGNPAVRQMVVDYAVKYFEENPNADMVSLEPADTLEGSYSPEARALGSNSDQVFGMANEVAKVLQKKHPGKMVGVLSYNTHWEPPTFKLEPNVHVALADLGAQQSSMSIPERNNLWSQRSRNLGFYDYYSVFAWNSDILPGSWFNDLKELQREIRRQVAVGGTSLVGEASPSWGLSGRSYYVATKLLWNPDIDVAALAEDFYDKAFGAGAPAMKKYYESIDTGKQPLMSGHLIGMLYQYVDEASKKTAGQNEIQARLDQLKLFLRYQQFQWMRKNDNPTEAERVALWVKMMKSVSRAREYSMNTWGMMNHVWGETATPGYTKADWQVTTPYTHEEIEAEFQEGLAHFKSKIRDVAPFVEYSKDLVPVQWPKPVAASVESVQDYQGQRQYYLYSFKGEDLEFSTYAGVLWGGINNYVVTDSEGKEIYRKDKLPGEVTTVNKVPVPKPGLYILEYNDNGSYWKITIAPGKVATISLLSKEGGIPPNSSNPFPSQNMYFYVPKGTRTFQYFFTKTANHSGGPHHIKNPDGELVSASALIGGKPNTNQDALGNGIIDVNGDYVDVPVPEGMDGKLWSFQAPVFGFFKFSNAPNYFAASPDALLLPRELAKKDGLALRE